MAKRHLQIRGELIAAGVLVSIVEQSHVGREFNPKPRPGFNSHWFISKIGEIKCAIGSMGDATNDMTRLSTSGGSWHIHLSTAEHTMVPFVCTLEQWDIIKHTVMKYNAHGETM